MGENLVVMSVELGRLEHVDPRSVWVHEAHDFTPWLLANADRLSEALGIDLELEAAEHAVGGYSLDLVGRDITNDAVLIVENQLATTDHSHLGQVLTYAAGTGASTIVWIATAFREEHRQALDWLNESTGDEAHFFGIELQLVKIGDSTRHRSSTWSCSRTTGRSRFGLRPKPERSAARVRFTSSSGGDSSSGYTPSIRTGRGPSGRALQLVRDEGPDQGLHHQLVLRAG